MSRLAQMLPNQLWQSQFGPCSVTGGTYTQAGTGDPSPSNIRAISPWKAAGASVAVKRCGKNLISLLFTPDNSNGMTLTVDADGTCHLTGTAANIATFYTPYLYIHPGTYTLAMNNPVAFGTANDYLQIRDSVDWVAGVVTPLNAIDSKYTFTASYNITRFRIRISSGITLNNLIIKPQLEPGSSATAYEPYISKSCTLTAPELYAGYLGDDWSWRRTVNHILLHTLTWSHVVDTNDATNATNYFLATGNAEAAATFSGAVSSHLTVATIGVDTTTVGIHIPPSNTIIRIRIAKATLGIDNADDAATRVTKLMTWLTAQSTAGTPVQVAYQLATPTVIAPTLP